MYRSRISMLFVVIAAALGLVASSASAAPPHSGMAPAKLAPSKHKQVVPPRFKNVPLVFQRLGAKVGPFETVTPEKADATVLQAKSVGLNSLHIPITWRDNGENGPRGVSDIDITSLCNAARSLEKYQMKALVIEIDIKRYLWPKLGDIAAVGRVNTAIGDIDAKLFSQPGGCLSTLSSVTVEYAVGNEPNVQTYCDPFQDGNNPLDTEAYRHKVCAPRAVQLMHYVYGFIHGDVNGNGGENSKYGVHMVVIGGGESSFDNPLLFFKSYCAIKKAAGYGPDMDKVDFHPYGGRTDPYSSFSMAATFFQMAATCLGPSVGHVILEMGVETDVSSYGTYQCPDPHNTYEASIKDYPVVLGSLLHKALSLGVDEYDNMLLNDERCFNPGWQTGLFYWDGKSKEFPVSIQEILAPMAPWVSLQRSDASTTQGAP
jgi:hypothetical protein